MWSSNRHGPVDICRPRFDPLAGGATGRIRAKRARHSGRLRYKPFTESMAGILAPTSANSTAMLQPAKCENSIKEYFVKITLSLLILLFLLRADPLKLFGAQNELFVIDKSGFPN